jgi:hypothetical protein
LNRAVILFGPPSIGKSVALQDVLDEYKDTQVLCIDKDIISGQFFVPKLDKDKNPQIIPLVPKTTSYLLDLCVSEYREALEFGGEKRGLTVVLQGVSLGGIYRDMSLLLDRGFHVEVVLLNCLDVEIIHTRIHERAKEPGYIGADPMSMQDLSTYIRECNKTFAGIVEAIGGGGLSAMTQFGSFTKFLNNKEFQSKLETAKEHVSVRAEILKFEGGFFLTSDTDIATFNLNIQRDYYSLDDMVLGPAGMSFEAEAEQPVFLQGTMP